MTIPGGYVLKPRKIKHSDIADASPCVRETWDYLIREANHKSFKRGKFEIKRGQLFRSYDEILDDLCWYVGWRKETYTKNQMKQAMKYLRDTERITTQKKPGGVLISVCNYSTYQDPSNYEKTTEETSEITNEKPLTNQEETSHNYKNVKNVKNEKKYSYGDSEKWDGEQPVDYVSFVDAFNELYNQSRRITDSKRENIRARLQTFSGAEIQKAWENRKNDDWLNGEGNKHMGKWTAAMRNDEKIDRYLNGKSMQTEKIDFGI